MTSDVLVCRETGLLPIGGRDGLQEAELEYLVRLRNSGPAFFTEERRDGRWQCRFAGFAGAIALPGGRTLEVLPKVGDEGDADARALVMRMLAATGKAPAMEDEELAAYAASPHLIEAYLRFAVDLALRQLRHGLVHAYRRFDLRLPVVRGRLRVAAQLARLPERVDAHLLTADLFTADTPVNRGLKAGIVRIERVSRVTETRARCRELLARLGAVGEPPADRRRVAAMLDGLVLDRRHRHLGPLLSVLRLILRDRGSAAAAGDEAPGPAWLFAMPKLFEALIARRLAGLVGTATVSAQGPSQFFDRGQQVSLCPDIVILQAGEPVLVLDTKWKRLTKGLSDVAPDDLRQVYTYARIYDVDRAVLVYPSPSNLEHGLARLIVASKDQVEISVVKVPVLGETWDMLDKTLTRLL